MTIERINVSVTGNAKQVLLDYQAQHTIKDQGNALVELLLEYKELSGGNNK